MRASGSPRERQSPPAAAEFVSNQGAMPESARCAYVPNCLRDSSIAGRDFARSGSDQGVQRGTREVDRYRDGFDGKDKAGDDTSIC